jgi:hypothetical protein
LLFSEVLGDFCQANLDLMKSSSSNKANSTVIDGNVLRALNNSYANMAAQTQATANNNNATSAATAIAAATSTATNAAIGVGGAAQGGVQGGAQGGVGRLSVTVPSTGAATIAAINPNVIFHPIFGPQQRSFPSSGGGLIWQLANGLVEVALALSDPASNTVWAPQHKMFINVPTTG